MIKLTKRLDNNTLYISPAHVSAITEQDYRGKDAKKGQKETILFIYGQAFHVLEPIEKVKELILNAL